MFLLKIHKTFTIAGFACFCALTVVMLSEQLLSPDFFNFGVDMVIPGILVLLLPILYYVFSITWNNKLRNESHTDLFFGLFFLGLIYISLNAVIAYNLGEELSTTRETNVFSAFFGAEKDNGSPAHLYYFVASLCCLIATGASLGSMIAIKKTHLPAHH